MKLNLNTEAKVRLTEQGATLWNAYWQKEHLPADIRPASKTAGDVLSIQLWEAMHIFGPHCFNGCRIPFEDNVIELPDEAA